MSVNDNSPSGGLIIGADNQAHNIVDILGGGTPVNNRLYDITQYAPLPGLIIGNDGRLYDLTVLLQPRKGEKGDTGAKGDKGDTGSIASLTVGTVQTGAAGSNAAASVSGTAANPVLNFTIPRGATGEKGDTGAKGDKGDPGQNAAMVLLWSGSVTSGSLTFDDVNLMKTFKFFAVESGDLGGYMLCTLRGTSFRGWGGYANGANIRNVAIAAVLSENMLTNIAIVNFQHQVASNHGTAGSAAISKIYGLF